MTDEALKALVLKAAELQAHKPTILPSGCRTSDHSHHLAMDMSSPRELEFYSKRATLEKLAAAHDAQEAKVGDLDQRVAAEQREDRARARLGDPHAAALRLKRGTRLNGLTDGDIERLRKWETAKRAGRAAREVARARPDTSASEPSVNGWAVLAVAAPGLCAIGTLFLGLPLWLTVAITIVWALASWLAHLVDQVLRETIPASEVEQRKIDWILGPELPALPEALPPEHRPLMSAEDTLC